MLDFLPQCPTVKDYTCYSAHATHGRLDDFLVSQCVLDWHPQTPIDSQLWLNHSAIYFSLTLPAIYNPHSTWRLTETLLNDTPARAAILEAILSFLRNQEADMPPRPVQWEALKCVLSGVPISHGAHLKRESLYSVSLLKEIQTLETRHKQLSDAFTFLDLAEKESGASLPFGSSFFET